MMNQNANEICHTPDNHKKAQCTYKIYIRVHIKAIARDFSTFRLCQNS